jgi:hypothetical protein
MSFDIDSSASHYIVVVVVVGDGVLFVPNVFTGTKYFLYVLETVNICVPTWNICKFITSSCSFSHCPSVICIFAANAVCKCTDILVTHV